MSTDNRSWGEMYCNYMEWKAWLKVKLANYPRALDERMMAQQRAWERGETVDGKKIPMEAKPGGGGGRGGWLPREEWIAQQKAKKLAKFLP